jgi:hypothetical protein
MVRMGPKDHVCPACGHRTPSVLHRGQSVICSNCGGLSGAENEGGNYVGSKGSDDSAVGCGCGFIVIWFVGWLVGGAFLANWLEFDLADYFWNYWTWCLFFPLGLIASIVWGYCNPD